MKPRIRIAIIAFAALIADQIIKLIAISQWTTPVTFFPWLKLIFTRNYGIAFGIELTGPILISLNVILLGLLILFMHRKLSADKRLSIWIAGLLIGGALGNLLDRIRLGYVIDYFSVGTFPVFNLADSFITVSIFLLILFYDKIVAHNKNKNGSIPKS